MLHATTYDGHVSFAYYLLSKNMKKLLEHLSDVIKSFDSMAFSSYHLLIIFHYFNLCLYWHFH